MLEGPVQPSTSLLLDYLSPSQLVSLRRAIQNRNFAVAESISGFIILKFVIMASTTLLIPSTVVDGTFPIIMDTKFDSARFVEGNAQGSVASGDATHSAYGNASIAPIYAYQGVLNGEFESPIGIQDGLVFLVFTTLLRESPIIRATGETEVFVPDISCEQANSTVRDYGMDSMLLELTFNSPSCYIGREQN